MTEKKKKLILSKNSTANYIYNLSNISDRFISEQKLNVIEALAQKELVDKDEIVAQRKSEDVDLEKMMEEKLVSLIDQAPLYERLNTARKTDCKYFKKKMLRTQGDEKEEAIPFFNCKPKSSKPKENLTHRLLPSPKMLATALTGRLL